MRAMHLCTDCIPCSHLCRQGVAEALLSCIRRFKRHDSVLVEVYKFIGPRYDPKINRTCVLRAEERGEGVPGAGKGVVPEPCACGPHSHPLAD